MPDQWGRITGNDFMGMANAMGTIQALGRQDAQWNQQQAARQEQKQFKDDANYNAGLYQPGKVALDEGSPYGSESEAREAAMRGTPAAKVRGKQIAAQGVQADKQIAAAEQDTDILKRENALWQQFSGLAPEQRDEFLDSYVPQNKNDFIAFSKFGTSLEMNDQFRAARIQRNVEKGKKRFQDWSNNLQAGAGFLAQGNTQMAEQYLETAINDSHHPLFVKKNKNGTYDLIYEEAGEKILMGDDITLEAAYKKAMAIPAKEFIGDYVAQKAMIAQKNREAPWTEWSNGTDSFEVKTVYKPSNPKAGVDLVYQKGGGLATNQDGSPMTTDQLTAAGFRPRNLDKELKEQKITTSKAAMNASNRKNAPKELTRKKLADIMAEGAKFFDDSGDFQVGENGELTTAGQNTRIKAVEFYEQNKGNPGALQGADARKFHVAKTLVGALDKYFNVPAQTPAVGGGKSPVPGAKKAKDGHWYVKDANGWSRVEVQENQAAQAQAMGNMGGQESRYGYRQDGTPKGSGFLGEIKNPDGSVSTELSIGVNIDGKDVDIPLLVPTLTPDEVKTVQSVKDPKQIPKTIVKKAVEYARKRQEQGKSPFAGPGETPASSTDANSGIRPELPQDISQWNVQTIPQNGQRVVAVITEAGPVPLTPEEIEMYKQYSSGQRDTALNNGLKWFQNNMTGTVPIHQ